jgi:hypothetical protein
MIEFKPDTIILLLGLVILFILEKKEKISILYFVLIACLLFVTTFFKQSFFIIYFLVYLFIFFHDSITIKQKVSLILLYSLIGVFALFVIFDIKNIYVFTVETMSKHPMLDMKSIIYYFGYGTAKNLIFILALIWFSCGRYKFFSVNKLESKYFIFAIVWFLFSSLSTAKLGGNIGNYEVGLVVLVPFAIYGFNDVFARLFEKRYFNYIVLSLFVVLIAVYSYKSITAIPKLINKIDQDQISLNYISVHFKNKNAFVDGDTYILAQKAELNILTESETVGHFNNIPNYDMSVLKNAIHEQEYDVFFIDTYFSYFKDEEIHKLFSEKYTLLNDASMPSHLVGKLYIKSKGN